jgi:DNA-binding SARP family transcriptional activator/ABC-type glycerol-3-phosphate transport system substrate-binding protein/energy-coupling factor transporter ATP-binding protein EcfA2
MEFRILGPLEVSDAGRSLLVTSARQRALLALLIINANRVLTPDRLIDQLWGESSPDSGVKAVVFHIGKLREILEPERAKGNPGSVLVTESAGYMLAADPDSIDAVRFERLASEGRSLLTHDPEAAAATLRDALSEWRSEPLVDFIYEPFAQPEIRRLEELRLRATEDRLEADLQLGRHYTVVGELEGLVDDHPLREQLRGQLMLALYRCGRQAEALRVCQEGRRLLAEELGIELSLELRQLEELILHQDPALNQWGPEPPEPAARNPYKGLRSFGELDSADFFGRETLIGRLIDRLSEVMEAGRFLTVVGPSGSGKSSVVRAGLIPALRGGAIPGSERWLITVMYPGSRPWEELEAALLRVTDQPRDGLRSELELDAHGLARALLRILPNDDSCLLLVVDQLEELFSLVGDDETRDRFLSALLDATAVEHSRLLVIATLRADFFDRLLRHPRVGEEVRDGIGVITPLTRQELERAITSPGAAVGVDFEPDLVAEIVSEVANQPGTLPMLQYALTELFDQRQSGSIGSAVFEEVGGVLAALGNRAEQTYIELTPQAQEAARHLFLGLVTSGDGGQAVAARVTRRDLDSLLGPAAPLGNVLDRFGRRRLLTFDRDPRGEPTVEVAHEALLSRWPRLAGWIEEQQEDLWVRSRLHSAAEEWVRSGRDDGFLLSAGRLDFFESFASGTMLKLAPADGDFLEASINDRGRQEAEDAARTAHERELERRAAKRLRSLVAVLATAVVAGSVLLMLVFGQSQTARRQEAIASARELVGASLDTLNVDPELSLLLGLEAAARTAGHGYVLEEVMDAVHWGLQDSGISYPPIEAPVATRAALEGPRGVFLVPPGLLLQHAAENMERELTSEECRTYLHQDTCPEPQDWSGDELDVMTADGPVPVDGLVSASLAATRVDVSAEFESALGPIFADFTEQHGISVSWQSGSTASGSAADGRRPDVVLTASTGLIASQAEQGHLIDMGAFVDIAWFRVGLDDYLFGLAIRDENRLYSLPWAVSLSSLVWYPLQEFEDAEYETPQTWDELIVLSERIAADGRTPWCLGIDSSSRPGDVATDWVEDLVLYSQGPEVYDRWVDHDLLFSDGAIRDAYERFGQLAYGEGYVLGGSVSIDHIERELAAWPMFTDPLQCWLHRDGSESRAAWPQARAVELRAFRFPAVDPQYSNALTGHVYMITVRRDRPEVRRLVEYLLTEEVAGKLANAFPVDGILPARDFNQWWYGDDDLRRSEDLLLRTALRAGLFRAGASELMPPQVGSDAFPQSLSTYLNLGKITAAQELPQVLDETDRAWP